MLAFPLGPAVAHMVDTYWTIVKNKQDTAIKTWNGKHMAVTAPQQILNPKSFWTEEQKLLAFGRAINSSQPNWQHLILFSKRPKDPLLSTVLQGFWSVLWGIQMEILQKMPFFVALKLS